MPSKWKTNLRALGVAGLLIGATFIAYVPAMNGGVIWDDDAHITKPELRSYRGLYRIWFDLRATQQYYPVVHSIFWAEYHVWGENTLGYHLVNISLHAISACLLALILYRLKIPGWFLASAIFALHPVQVETVAWITELKNTLSGAFYLLSALIYLRFDQNRKPAMYIAALGLFVLGLLSKSVIASLPAALLVVFWWQRGMISRKRDLLPLLPWLVIGAGAGLFTAWVERKYIGAEGAEFDFGPIQRGFLAGHVVWFYLGKLLWPTKLIFIYPKWDLNHLTWWDYLYLPSAIVVLIATWSVRGRWRGPLAALLFFGGSLFPVLGFFNVFPFIYSFVADHFQYLACIGVIVFISANATLLMQWLNPKARWVGRGACAAIVIVLATLTWQQGHIYRDGMTLYLATLERNPDCSMAHNNLAVLLRLQGNYVEARNHVERALSLEPTSTNAHINFSIILGETGHLDQAIAESREALRLDPRYPKTHNNLGAFLARTGDLEGAKTQYIEAIHMDPNLAEAHGNLGRVYFLEGNREAAIGELKTTLSLDPTEPHANYTYAQILATAGDVRAAIPRYVTAMETNSRWTGPANDLAWILATNHDPKIRNGVTALKYAMTACQLDGFKTPQVLDTLAAAQAENGQFRDAQETIQRAISAARSRGQDQLLADLESRLSLYRRGIPYHEP